MTQEYTLMSEDGGEYTIELPVKYEVCPRCDGHGTHLNPSIGEHAYTPEEFAESFDEEEATEYFRRGGRYDVTCEKCRGGRVSPVIDVRLCTTPEQQQALRDMERSAREDREYEAMVRAERAFGC